MSSTPRQEATSCLGDLGRDPEARDRLFQLVYEELHDQAAAYMRQERLGHTLQTTGLVHEAWVRLIDQRQVEVRSRGHFLALAAQAMRRILVDHARGRLRDKRGGGWERVELGEEFRPETDGPDELDLLALDDAVTRLQERSEELAQIVELKFFSGLTTDEIASTLEIDRSTVVRKWRAARALLTKILSEGDGG